MRIRTIVAVALVTTAVSAATAFVAAQQPPPPPSAWTDAPKVAAADTGVGQYFTAEQAVRGEALYNRHCGYCHNADPKNKPVITGVGGQRLAPSYIQKQTDGNPRYPSAYYLFKRMEYMPPNDVESVTPQQRADILAYVLRQNGLAPGPSELTADYARMKAMPLPAEPGFVHVFNGRDFTGLQFLLGYHCTPQPEGCGKTDPAGIFSVVDGALRTNGRVHGYVYTARKYKNFTLRMEQRIVAPWTGDIEDLVQDQSGIMLFLGYKGDEPRIWGGYLLEVEGKYHELLSIYGPLKNITLDRELRRRVIAPANQWQRIDIESKNGMLKCYLNGTLVSTAELPADLAAGYIALQSQGGPIEWRNVRIKEE
jgi:S-disulfanyl-L-cysteine oxidoreductase SoxD